MLTLYDYFRSSASYRVRIALNLKQLHYNIIPVHLLKDGGEQHSEHFQRINPQSLVPALTVDNTVLTQSLAIIEYLDEAHPTPALLPSSPIDKAWVRSFALIIAADMHPLNNLRVLNYLASEFQVSESQKNTWYLHWLNKGLAALEKKAQTSPKPGTFCYGETPTLADICLVPQLYNARRFNCDLTNYPALVRIDAACRELLPFANAAPEKAPESMT